MKRLFIIILATILSLSGIAQINDTWDAVKVGTTDMNRIYVGDALVWQKLDVTTNLVSLWEMNNSSWPQPSEVGTAPMWINIFPAPQMVNGLLGLAANITSEAYYAWTEATNDYSPNIVSVSMWIKGDAPAAFDEEKCIFRFTGNGLALYLSRDFSGSSYFVRIEDINFAITPAIIPLSESQWNHIVVTRSSSSIYLYTNGDLVYSVTGINNGTSSPSAVAIGGYGTPATWVGLYDQVAIYIGRQIGLAEVKFINNNGNGRSFINW